MEDSNDTARSSSRGRVDKEERRFDKEDEIAEAKRQAAFLSIVLVDDDVDDNDSEAGVSVVECPALEKGNPKLIMGARKKAPQEAHERTKKLVENGSDGMTEVERQAAVLSIVLSDDHENDIEAGVSDSRQEDLGGTRQVTQVLENPIQEEQGPGAFPVFPWTQQEEPIPTTGSRLSQLADPPARRLTQDTVNTSLNSSNDNDSDRLVVATPVQAHPKDLPQAEQVHLEDQSSKTSGLKWIVLTATVCLVVLAAVFLSPQQRNSEEDSTSPLRNATTENEATLTASILQRLDLPNYTLTSIHDDPGSPRSRALEWILQDPFLQGYSDYRLLQRFVLAVFYYSTLGDSWLDNTNWIGHNSSEDDYTIHECDYYSNSNTFKTDIEYLEQGPHCSDRTGGKANEGGHLLRLNLHQNNLQGTLPPELGLLTSLEVLQLWGNSLRGTISSYIGELRGLGSIALMYNNLSGTLPTELGRLTNLNLLGAENNPRLEGTIPTQLGLLTKLEFHFLAHCALAGPIPPELGQLSSTLRYLSLHGNQLTGTIPSELGELHTVEGCYINRNRLSGTIPTDLGQLSRLWWLYLGENLLTGNIPSELGALAELQSLMINANRLSASIPSELGQLTRLSKLDLHGNLDLSGTIASEIGLLGDFNLTVLFNVNNTSLSGTVPRELCSAESAIFTCSALLCGCDCPCI